MKRTNGIGEKDEKKMKWNGYVVDISIYVFTINSVRYVGVGRFVSFFPLLPADASECVTEAGKVYWTVQTPLYNFNNNNDMIFQTK